MSIITDSGNTYNYDLSREEESMLSRMIQLMKDRINFRVKFFENKAELKNDFIEKPYSYNSDNFLKAERPNLENIMKEIKK